jgi:hypothetical protein
MIAPIALFVYNRPWHTQQTVKALQKNGLAQESDLFIFSDAAKAPDAEPQVADVRNYIRTVDGFKSVKIIEREKNWGLANSINDGVTEACKSYGRVIVLEDDIVTSPYFLTFMNAALDRYANEPKIWHISGWNYPIDPESLGGAFLWRAMNCWGWATWADRWQHFRKDPAYLVKTWDKDKIKRFNLDGAHDFWEQVKLNYSGKINTWAIFWYATIFDSGGLCLNRAQSLVRNIGHDGTGENCGASEWKFLNMNMIDKFDFPETFVESAAAAGRVKRFYLAARLSLWHRAFFRAKLWLMQVAR